LLKAKWKLDIVTSQNSNCPFKKKTYSTCLHVFREY